MIPENELRYAIEWILLVISAGLFSNAILKLLNLTWAGQMLVASVILGLALIMFNINN